MVDSQKRNDFPGFGLPRCDAWKNDNDRFLHMLETTNPGKLSKGVTLRERRMMDFMNQITDKPDWERKVFDRLIVGKWRSESEAMATVENDDVFMSKAMFNYCMRELREKAKRLETTGFVNVLDAEMTVVKSDRAVSPDLAAALARGAGRLEDVPEWKKDWHPDSDNTVLDLLHPSLFPAVFGRTRALRTGTVPLDDCIAYTCTGDLTDLSPIPSSTSGVDPYQWLPSEVALTDAGASITSYINNLHPSDHKELYGVLAKFVDAAVPLWEECLSWDGDQRRLKIFSTNDEFDYHLPKGVAFPREQPDDDTDDEDDYLYTDEYIEWHEQHRILDFPEPDDYTPLADRLAEGGRVNLRAEFPKGLQIIFKLANIHLTPDKPAYGGGAWHVEGTLSEHICASALYYYDEDNISPSHLAFRQCVDEEEMAMMPAQSAYNSLEAYMGVEQNGPAVQELGRVLTRPGRLLAFPNVLQHRVEPFMLQDPTKPGHRKILAMFLVDPERRIISTAHVPPQRKDWWSDHVREVPAIARLPVEISTHILNFVDSDPMSWDEAIAIRADLMERRGRIQEGQNDTIASRTFSFCEH